MTSFRDDAFTRDLGLVDEAKGVVGTWIGQWNKL